MNCPKCKSGMRQLAVGDMLLDRCRNCYGLWLDDGELNTLKKIQNTGSIDLGIPEGVELEAPSHLLRCSKCRCRLNTKRSYLEYETCPQCRGIFLDAGELSKKKNFTLAQKIKGFFGLGG